MSASEPLVKIRNLEIEGIADETRVPIINKVDLDLKRGEVLGLIGESVCWQIHARPCRDGIHPRWLRDCRRLGGI